jgi:hypothetical protein
MGPAGPRAALIQGECAQSTPKSLCPLRDISQIGRMGLASWDPRGPRGARARHSRGLGQTRFAGSTRRLRSQRTRFAHPGNAWRGSICTGAVREPRAVPRSRPRKGALSAAPYRGRSPHRESTPAADIRHSAFRHCGSRPRVPCGPREHSGRVDRAAPGRAGGLAGAGEKSRAGTGGLIIHRGA